MTHTRKHPVHPRLESGMSLLAVMVAVAVSGVLVVAIAQMFRNSNAAQSELQNKVDQDAARRYILSAFSCSQTLTGIGASCAIGSAVELRSQSTKKPILVNKTSLANGPYSQIGQLSLRASCAACSTCATGKKLLVEAATIVGSGKTSNFAKSQLTGKDRAWKDINNGIPLACQIP